MENGAKDEILNSFTLYTSYYYYRCFLTIQMHCVRQSTLPHPPSYPLHPTPYSDLALSVAVITPSVGLELCGFARAWPCWPRGPRGEAWPSKRSESLCWFMSAAAAIHLAGWRGGIRSPGEAVHRGRSWNGHHHHHHHTGTFSFVRHSSPSFSVCIRLVQAQSTSSSIIKHPFSGQISGVLFIRVCSVSFRKRRRRKLVH